ncbi:hypothetical protein ES703_15793 [subsurface metagenome]|jgi:hypothetical protein
MEGAMYFLDPKDVPTHWQCSISKPSSEPATGMSLSGSSALASSPRLLTQHYTYKILRLIYGLEFESSPY